MQILRTALQVKKKLFYKSSLKDFDPLSTVKLKYILYYSASVHRHYWFNWHISTICLLLCFFFIFDALTLEFNLNCYLRFFLQIFITQIIIYIRNHNTNHALAYVRKKKQTRNVLKNQLKVLLSKFVQCCHTGIFKYQIIILSFPLFMLIVLIKKYI